MNSERFKRGKEIKIVKKNFKNNSYYYESRNKLFKMETYKN